MGTEYTFEVPGPNSPSGYAVVDGIIAQTQTLNPGPLGVLFPGDFNTGTMSVGVDESVNGYSPDAAFHDAQGTLSAVVGVGAAVIVPASSTISEADAVFGAIRNYSAVTGAVAGRFQSQAMALGAAVAFGLNVQATDNGNAMNGVIGCEWDIEASNTLTPVYGQNIIGIFPNGVPQRGCSAIQVSILDGSPWGTGFATLSGAAQVALSVGAAATTPNSNSQGVNFLAYDSSGTLQIAGIVAQATAGGASLHFSTPNGGVVIDQIEVVSGLASFAAAISVTAGGSGALEALYSGATQVGEIFTDGTNCSVGASVGKLALSAATGAEVQVLSPLQLPQYTIASGARQLPAASSSTVGQMAQVTDFSGDPTYRGAIGSGGSNVVVNVLCINSTTWVTV